MNRHEQLERELVTAGSAFPRPTVASDAWQENERRLAADRARRSRRARRALATAAVVAGLVGAGVAVLAQDGPASSPPAGLDGRGPDPFQNRFLLGEPVELETYRVDGVTYVHRAALSDMTGDGPDLCDRTTASDGGSSDGCTRREPGADDPAVAVDWLMGTEGRGNLRGVTGAVDARVSFIVAWLSDGERVSTGLLPGGWEGSQLFGLTVPADGPIPQRLVAVGRDGNVLQSVDLPRRFGQGWLRPRHACAGDQVAEYVPDGDVLPNAYVALGTADARISARLSAGDSAETCLERLRATALAGWFANGSLVVAVVAPEVENVRVTDGRGYDRQLLPEAVAGSPWQVAVVTDLPAGSLPSVEVIVMDGHGLELDRAPVSQPSSP